MEIVKFGTDGVRAKAGSWPINAAGAQRIGLGLGRFLKERFASPSVLIGRDTRISGDVLVTAMSSGLLSFGVDVVDAGVITTAGIAYLAKFHPYNLGVVISASHNHWTENGIKLIGPDGYKLDDNLEKLVETYINDEETHPSYDFGKFTSEPALAEEYIRHLIAPFEKTDFSGLKVVIDCSNGAASRIATECFNRLGANAIFLHNSPDGKNINNNSGSEIVREGRGDLIPRVIQEKASFGIAYDGDADRAVFIDGNGKLVDGDHVLFILGKFLQQNGQLPGACVVTTEMANAGLEKALESEHIKTVYTPVGDKYVVREMIRHGYRLGGEQSGHIIILDDSHTTGDGIYTSLFLSQVLIDSYSANLSLAVDGFHKFPQVIASARVTSKPGLENLAQYHDELSRVMRETGEHVIVNTRYSGTEPLLRVMIQSYGDHTLEEVARHAMRLCRSVQECTGDAGNSLEVKDCTTGTSLDLILNDHNQ